MKLPRARKLPPIPRDEASVATTNLFELALGLGGLEAFLLYISIRRLPHVIIFHDALQRLPR